MFPNRYNSGASYPYVDVSWNQRAETTMTNDTVRVKRLILDVLKPHKPDGLEFCRAIAEQGERWRIVYSVEEMDKKTENVSVLIEGEDLRFDLISAAIENAGGTIHSIDEVEVLGDGG